ncbi:hypothetical protein SAMN05878503_10250 [Cereibacter ovatus]|uniref:Uncharacterized protein n=1 Tax=Cereibacter ovatus TaxID=439529 RepID=A0A285CMR8_9RHOB|nr:hypothetical protein [Cereibacter ovatus]SNX68293.1 hypothetical protein SAMN05878503_10250 [Cereibacter ovatus]
MKHDFDFKTDGTQGFSIAWPFRRKPRTDAAAEPKLLTRDEMRELFSIQSPAPRTTGCGGRFRPETDEDRR